MSGPEASVDGAGRRVAGRYRLTSLVSAGGSGTVWAAVDEVLGREVAIKDVGASPFLDGPDRRPVREHTLREAQAASRVEHPAVVKVHDVLDDDGRLWIVMQLIKAPSLAELIGRNGPCSPHQVARIGLQLLGALRAAHARGIVHRDVKPSNVLVDGEQAVLTDFGIAAIDGETTPPAQETLVGAPSYIAPECICGEPASPASDLWALGATLYAAVEGRPPYRRDTAWAVLTAAVTCEPDPLSRAGMLAPLLTQMLSRQPAQRPSADRVERYLERLLSVCEAVDTEPDPTGDPVDAETSAIRIPPSAGAFGPPDREDVVRCRRSAP